jgi:peptide/nickel transport system substrate-binding protein
MGKKIVKGSSSNGKSTMKEALKSIGIKKSKDVNDRKLKKKDFRDILWNYPIYISKLFKSLIPLSYIVLFAIVGISISFLLDSEVVARILNGSGSENTFTEGSVGAISTFNPLFVSVNYVDKAVQELVFDRFIYISKDGEPLPGIAESWSVSSDRLEYRFKIKEDVFWHNGTPLTIEDILFTFDTAKALSEEFGFDSVGVSLIGVDVSKDGGDVVFKLSEPNPTFFEAVSLFIVPKSRLENVDLSQMAFDMFSRYPIGTGRYMVTRTEQNTVFLQDNKYDSRECDIQNIVFKVFPDKQSMEMSFRIGVLDAIGSWDYELLKFTEEYSNLSSFKKVENYRTKLLFFNTRRGTYKGKEIRLALNYLINKAALLENSGIGGVVRKGPFPEDSWAFNSNIDYYAYDPEKAAEILNNLGFTKDEESGYFENDQEEILSFTISYFDSVTNERLISILKELLKNEGVVLKGEKLNYNQITQEIIATRDFDILLYEVETTVDPDQYNLWHSLKSNYPDLNISGYSYERVDILLEDARKTSQRNVRKEKYDLVQKYIMADSPVIFLYNPTFHYFVKDNIKGVDLSDINYSYERFKNIQDWYFE